MTGAGEIGSNSGRGEAGATLILALAFLLIVGATIAILTTWATNDLNNTHQFSNVRLVHNVETDVLNLDVSLVRPTPSACSSTSFAQTVDLTPVDVWCSSVSTPTSSVSRTVTFWSCLASVSKTNCESSTPGVSIKAVVLFDDYTSGVHVPSQFPCTSGCGTGMTITAWTVT